VLQLAGKSSGGKGRGKKTAAPAAAAPSESEGSGSGSESSGEEEEEQQPQPKKQVSTGRQRGRPRKPQHPTRSMLDEASNGTRERKVRVVMDFCCGGRATVEAETSRHYVLGLRRALPVTLHGKALTSPARTPTASSTLLSWH
jgi:hypothetical protein